MTASSRGPSVVKRRGKLKFRFTFYLLRFTDEYGGWDGAVAGRVFYPDDAKVYKTRAGATRQARLNQEVVEFEAVSK